MTRKSRHIFIAKDQWRTWVRTYAPGPFSTYIGNGYQVTDTPRTYWKWLRKNAIANRAHFDLGGNFYTVRPFGHHVKKFSGLAISGNYYFEGDMVAARIPGNDPAKAGLLPADRDELVRRGTTAIKRCAPINPVVSGATALGEFRKDGLAKLPGLELLRSKGKDLTRKTGGEYLNIEFALKPLISDVRGVYKAAHEQSKILEQLHRDSGKLIRRSYTFPTETTSSTTMTYGNLAVPTPAIVTGFYRPGIWSKSVTTEVVKTYKFSGAFTYHLPTDESQFAKMRVMATEANRLYGIRIDPEVIYNLTPWSWALDWVSSTGDLLHNVSSAVNDGLVLAYGYIMCHTTSTTTVTCVGPGLYGMPGSEYKTVYGFESKARIKATPFGFGLDTALFSERQWSIIGALGLTKAPKILP